jgi:hypothetical protein
MHLSTAKEENFCIKENAFSVSTLSDVVFTSSYMCSQYIHEKEVVLVRDNLSFGAVPLFVLYLEHVNKNP